MTATLELFKLTANKESIFEAQQPLYDLFDGRQRSFLEKRKRKTKPQILSR